MRRQKTHTAVAISLFSFKRRFWFLLEGASVTMGKEAKEAKASRKKKTLLLFQVFHIKNKIRFFFI